VKGVASLIGSGTVEGSPQAVASFLRQHIAELDKTQLGEYFGHHDEQAVSLPGYLLTHIRLLMVGAFHKGCQALCWIEECLG
jgi:hypothetical protein